MASVPQVVARKQLPGRTAADPEDVAKLRMTSSEYAFLKRMTSLEAARSLEFRDKRASSSIFATR